MGVSDGREPEFKFADFYAAVTVNLKPVSKRKSNNPRVNRRWSYASGFYARIRAFLSRYGRRRYGRGTEREASEVAGKIVSLTDREAKEKQR